MTFSCTDFTEKILALLAWKGWIDGDRIPDGDPEAQYDLAAQAIGNAADELQNAKALTEALFVLLVKRDGEWIDSAEGPFTFTEAKDFAECEVGVPYLIVAANAEWLNRSKDQTIYDCDNGRSILDTTTVRP